MTRERMLKIIYDKIGDKRNKRGCKVKFSVYLDNNTLERRSGKLLGELKGYNNRSYHILCTEDQKLYNEKISETEVIGQPILLGYVARLLNMVGLYIKEATVYIPHWCASPELGKMYKLWSLLDQPLDNQSDECIEYVKMLINKYELPLFVPKDYYGRPD